MAGGRMRTERYAPVNGVLVVTKDPLPDKVGSIHLAKQSASRPQTGTIRMSDTEAFPAGWQIVFAPHSGVIADLDGEAVLLLMPSEVLAVVRPC